ncbi:glycerol-3-phosphate 1-O-acyltransferase PlsY [Devosia sp.]|uniref:glycerol-3-phosphate 1-O-acyltransferase PlsY n=1 Tax=Devosia sp. TaxID=1871048 RepID=UPI003F71B2C2
MVAFWMSVGLLVAAYLLGAIPAGYLAGRGLRGIDIRQHGSKSTGATNALRVLGVWPALLVLLVDLLKGGAAVGLVLWLWPLVVPDQPALLPWIVCLAGLAALFGHARSIWLHFSGGKSVATGLGVVLALSWPVGLGALVVFAVALAISRIVSLSSLSGALTAVVLAIALDLPLPYRLLVIAGGIYVIVRHRANIGRLLAGTEPRLGQQG